MNLELALGWFCLNLLTIVLLAFYSMEEMALVSFNKIRLHYYVSKGMKRAIWLNYLLQQPIRLFGTTLLSVNIAMFIGSEFSRQTFIALGWNPDLALPLQVAIVVVFGELAPMFAARHYAENVALLGAPILYATAKVMAPILWAIGSLSKLLDYFTGHKPSQEHFALNQEDLQKILSMQDEEYDIEGDDFNAITRNLFSLRAKDAKQIMQLITNVPVISVHGNVEQLKQLFRRPNVRCIPVYRQSSAHIVGIIFPRDILRIPDNKRVREYASAPWFITQSTSVIQVLKEFRRNNKAAAIVLDTNGLAIGIITLEDLLEEIFGEMGEEQSGVSKPHPTFIIDRIFPGEMTVGEFNAQFDVILDEEVDITLSQLMTRTLGHSPELGETAYIAPFELTANEISLTEATQISVTTRIL